MVNVNEPIGEPTSDQAPSKGSLIKLLKTVAIGTLPGASLIAMGATLSLYPLLSHVLEAVGAALIGAAVAVPAMEIRGHDRLIQRIVNNLIAASQKQHDRLAEINQVQHDTLASINQKQHEELARINHQQLEELTRRAESHIDRLMSVVSGKAVEVLPKALDEAFSKTTPDAKLSQRTWSFVKNVMTLEEKESWTDDVSILFIGALLYYVSENAISLASAARHGGSYPIRLPKSSASLAASILADQMNSMVEKDEYNVLSDLSSWSGELSQFHEATEKAVARGVRVRRLICPFSHDADLSEDRVRNILVRHWKTSMEGPRDSNGKPLYEVGVVKQTAVRGIQLHHVGIFRHEDKGVMFEPYEPDLSEMHVSKTASREPANLLRLWERAERSYRQKTGSESFELVSVDDVWAALGPSWWKPPTL